MSNHQQITLVRGEDGQLHIRRIAIPSETPPEMSVEPCSVKRMFTPARLAKMLGVSKRTINQRCADGDLPFVDHGTSKRPRRFIKPEIVRLVKERGLGGVARMRQAGLLSSALAALLATP